MSSNETKNNHYVPQFYQKSFVNEQDKYYQLGLEKNILQERLRAK